ncbi:bicaudal D-related protein homolog isoform X2 [Corticium candelabrum]|uniref:bicaudal D-related protein homolog isoform X2 n=1 Tax=Corticium candelabrum TaxID=121492 RepID=UPI002E25FA26|nr:bicaudal D-related protein homolog isoform X2 [Corticium candelabrum]
MGSRVYVDRSNNGPRTNQTRGESRLREIRWTSLEVEKLETELTRREGDLKVAAEIGTTLLEKMRILEEENERLQSECAKHLESRNRRVYELDRKLSECAFEADDRVHQLKAEIAQLKSILAKERRSHLVTTTNLNRRVLTLEAENARLHGKINALHVAETVRRSEKSEHARQLKQVTDQLETTQQTLEYIEAEASAIAASNLQLKYDVETVTNERDRLREELKMKECEILAAQQDIDELRSQLQSKQNVITQLRETCVHLKDEVEEKQAQDSVSRTSTSEVSLMSELQECLILSPVCNFQEVLEEKDRLSERNSQLDIDLMSVKIELKRVEEQLMVAVHQKLELTKQLEEWQLDMAELVEKQISRKLSEEVKPRHMHMSYQAIQLTILK